MSHLIQASGRMFFCSVILYLVFLFSSGCVESIFSTLKIIKTDRRTRLNNSTLGDLLDVSVEGPEIKDFSPDRAIDAWWSDCATTRRVNQRARKTYRPRQSASGDTDLSSEEEELALSDWDRWFDNDMELEHEDK